MKLVHDLHGKFDAWQTMRDSVGLVETLPGIAEEIAGRLDNSPLHKHFLPPSPPGPPPPPQLVWNAAKQAWEMPPPAPPPPPQLVWNEAKKAWELPQGKSA